MHMNTSMVKIVLLIVVIFSLFLSCASSGRVIQNVPKLYNNKSEAATVMVIREHQVTANTVSCGLQLDGNLIAYFAKDKYTTMLIQPGEHFIAVSRPGVGIGKYDFLHFIAEPNKKYFFKFSIVRNHVVPGGGWIIEPLSEKEASELLKNYDYKYITINN